MSRVLLVSPTFHGYWSAFSAALAQRGHTVTAHRYDQSGDGGWSWRNTLAHRAPRTRLAAAVREAASSRAIEALRATRPESVLVVKGDALSDDWWDAVERSGARVVVWLYDELSRMTYTLDRLRAIGAVLSYSPADVARLRAAGIDADHLADGFDSLTPFSTRHSDAVSFIGARYPERERVLRVVRAAGHPVEAYGREWSRRPWDVVRTGRFHGAGVASFGDVPRQEYYAVMAGSVATLNIHGAGHDGLSMRTFEAPGVGALSLIDRPAVALHYDVGVETLVFTSDDELLDHLSRARRDRAWADAIRAAGRRRTLAEHTLVHRMASVERRWG